MTEPTAPSSSAPSIPHSPLPAPAAERPLTEGESASLSRTGGPARFAGLALGGLGLALSAAHFAGLQLYPPIYASVVLWAGVLGVAISGRSRASRTGAARALGSGAARQVRGVAGLSRKEGWFVRGADVLVTTRFRASFQRAVASGSEATLLISGGAVGPGRRPNGCILAVNGTPLRRPIPCRVLAVGAQGSGGQ